MQYSEDDYLQLSGMQHYCYCKRQWYLIHIMQIWAEDARTVSGNIFHKNVDDPFKKEKRGDTVISRSIPVSSSILGMSGRCDAVEFRKDESGVFVPQIGFKCTIVPIEYKVGHKKTGKWDEVQLCAEAICLEETFKTRIDRAYIYYGLERRRTEVDLSDDLRQITQDTAIEMHEAFEEGKSFNPDNSKECKKCSLVDLCMPFLIKDVDQYIFENEK